MIAVECFPDEILVRSLGIPVAKVRHSCGKGNVVNDLLRSEATTGLIDEDPGKTQPLELAHFQAVERHGNVVLLACREQPEMRLVMICPRLEEWLLARAEACGVRPQRFGLPASTKELRRLGRYERRPKYRDFVRDILASDAEMQVLRKWISA